jgi:DNA-binding response OmpR family regulator
MVSGGPGADRADQVWRVVVADDDVPLRTLVRFTLQRDERFKVVALVGDGDETLGAVDREDPDLLLLDVAMPGRDGLQVLSDLSGQDRPLVVVLTGLTDPDLEDEVRAAGAVGYLTKATAFDGLGDHLAALLAVASDRH